ncbi:acyltransferase, partial [Amycolatopsis mediterranei]
AQAGAAPETLLVDVDPAVPAQARAATGALANRRL